MPTILSNKKDINNWTKLDGFQSNTVNVTWATQSAPDNDNRRVVYGDDKFVAIGTKDGLQSHIITSPDGITWTAQTVPEATASWFGIAYANNMYVATATIGNGRVMTSPDAITWTSHSIGTKNGWYAVTYGSGTWVAVATSVPGNDNNRVMTSSDATSWSSRSVDFTGGASVSAWKSITYADSIFVAVANSGTHRSIYSSDGVVWQTGSIAANRQWWSVTYGKDKFVAVDVAGHLAYSYDGITWATGQWPDRAGTFYSIAYGNGIFVISNAINTNCAISRDGINWQTHQDGGRGSGIVYGAGRFVSVGTGDVDNVAVGYRRKTTFT